MIKRCGEIISLVLLLMVYGFLILIPLFFIWLFVGYGVCLLDPPYEKTFVDDINNVTSKLLSWYFYYQEKNVNADKQLYILVALFKSLEYYLFVLIMFIFDVTMWLFFPFMNCFNIIIGCAYAVFK